MFNNNYYMQLYGYTSSEQVSNMGEYFLITEKNTISAFFHELEQDGIIADYTLMSLSSVLQWSMGRATLLSKISEILNNVEGDGIDESIEAKKSYNISEILSLLWHSAYYVAETYRRNGNSMSWKTSPKLALNGFRGFVKMYPVDELYSLYNNILSHKDILSEVEGFILKWTMKL